MSKIEGFTYCKDTGEVRRILFRGHAVPAVVVGCLDSNGYLRVTHERVNNTLHRLIFKILGIEIPLGMDIDHINGIRDDNRWSNLRIVTHRQNLSNQYCHRNGRVVGVRKKFNRYEAYARTNGRNKHIGTYLTEAEAIAARAKFLAESFPTVLP